MTCYSIPFQPTKKTTKRYSHRKTHRKQFYGTSLLIIAVVLFVAWSLVVGGKVGEKVTFLISLAQNWLRKLGLVTVF